MKIKNSFLLLMLCIFSLSGNALAMEYKAYLSQFTVTGAANKEEIKTSINTLLMTRLNGDNIVTVDSADSADILISVSYIAFGNVFSIDATAKSKSGNSLVRVFEQGENQNEILSAVGKIANSLKAGINKRMSLGAVKNELSGATAKPLSTSLADSANSEAGKQASTSEIMVKPVVTDTGSVLVKAEGLKTGVHSWISQKIEGEQIGIASGRNLPEKGREIFIAGRHSLKYYLLSDEMRLVTEAILPINLDIVSVDTADLDGDGKPEIYLTVFNGENIASQVWQANGTELIKIDENLPYLFRGVTTQLKKTLYAQELDRNGNYYGDVFVVIKKGTGYGKADTVKLPRGFNIYNCRTILLDNGKHGLAGINLSGYLVVYDENQKELWRSSDKYGGSETFFTKNTPQDVSISGSTIRKVFLEQRIIQTAGGNILVPQNDGSFIIGDSRSYSKNSVYSFRWNGVSLEENWHTKLSQNYLVDYSFEEATKELLVLEVVKKEGIFDKGASAVAIKKVE